ncbi:MAG: TlpA family protein disulfide reductase [Gemmatimonadetes bacterium]|nr:TlpA family protein disulfide reductase [Gemmatimonadota bacterium]
MNRNRSRACLTTVAVGALALAGGCVPEDRTFAIDRPAPDYAAANLAGDTLALSDLEGEVVLLNLWATWCAPCRHETPFLQSIYERYRERGFRVVGVSQETSDAADQIAQFTDEYGVTYTILHDTQLRGDRIYHAPGLPATFLIDREGVLRWLRYGPVDETTDGFIDAIEEALGDA